MGVPIPLIVAAASIVVLSIVAAVLVIVFFVLSTVRHLWTLNVYVLAGFGLYTLYQRTVEAWNAQLTWDGTEFTLTQELLASLETYSQLTTHYFTPIIRNCLNLLYPQLDKK